MLKIAINSLSIYKTLYKFALLRKLIVLDLRVLNLISSSEDFAFATSRFTGGNSHGKITAVDRFKDISNITEKHLSNLHKNIGEEVKIHDIGVSTGVTSCELLESIKKIPNLFYISDIYTNYFYSGNSIVSVYDRNNNFIYGYLFFFLADKNVSKLFFISKILFYILKIIPSKKKLNSISFLDKKTRNYIDYENLIFIDYDIFHTPNKINEFNFIRCMNVLNRASWFSDNEIMLALINLKNSLTEGGILLIGRTEDSSGINNISFYTKVENKFQLTQEVNRGSEINNLVLSC